MRNFLLTGVAALAVALAGPAFAQHHGGGGHFEGGHEHFEGGHEHFEHRGGGPGFELEVPGAGVEIGPGGFHGRFLGFGPHWYHGRNWAYGEGPCWDRNPYNGRWYWVCD